MKEIKRKNVAAKVVFVSENRVSRAILELLLCWNLFHFFSLFLPPGAPLALAPLLVPIELISYVFRVVALSVRLFANMMAGHTLLKILATFAWKMLSIGGIFLIIQLFPLAVISIPPPY